MSAQITFRPSESGDAPLLFRLFAENKVEEFSALGLGSAQLEPLIQMQYHARCAGYNQSFPGAEQQIIMDSAGQAVGQALLLEEGTFLRIIDISIAKSERGKGLGSAAILAIQARVAAKGKSLRLNVVTGSRAQTLYERRGFVVTAQSSLGFEMEWQPRRKDAARFE